MSDVKPPVQFNLQAPWDAQQEFFRAKLNIPTNHWDDIMKEAHDRGFMVAGAFKADLLNDLRQAVDKSLTEGKSIAWFRKHFDQIVQQHGWDYKGERNWRTRVIYQTNMLSSYAAGRYQQLTDPEMLQAKPYWVYRHGHPVIPRQLHLDWNGMALAATDPWWQIHFPPNGWGCTCRVTAASKAEIDQHEGWHLPDHAPDDGYDTHILYTGEVIQMPSGVDYGWDYAPGATVAEQLRGKLEALRQSLPAPLQQDFVDDMASMTALSRALTTAETAIRQGKTEHSVILDDDGTLLAQAEGDANSVEIDGALARGKTVTHWHPVVTAFSWRDIRTACKLSVREMRAVDAVYTYSMKPPPDGWDLDFWEQTVQPQFDAAEAEQFGKLFDRLHAGEITQADMERELYHLIWAAVANKTGMTYGRR